MNINILLMISDELSLVYHDALCLYYF